MRDATSYYRELDLYTAIARVSYKAKEITFVREVFAGAPDQAIIIHICADKPGNISCDITMGKQKEANTWILPSDRIELRGTHLKFSSMALIRADNGTIGNSRSETADADADRPPPWPVPSPNPMNGSA